jgi:carbonic anhydrase/acetyltransferase-like protein (isoleucine patch superfamily)
MPRDGRAARARAARRPIVIAMPMSTPANLRPYRRQWPRLGANVYLDAAALVVGEVEIDDDASLWPFVVARGDVNRIRIGARTNVQDGSVLHVTHDGPYTPGGFPLVIGADVTIGHGAILHACTIEDACLIGMRATVLDGAVVRRHAMIGAGAVVTPGKLVGEGELWLGNPARCVRMLTATQIEQLYYSAQHYVRLKDEYLAAQREAAPP